jgi:hypothetical protein
LLDANLRFLQAGHPTWLRVRNFPDIQSQPYAQLGFSISPTGQYGQTGTTDISIQPPAAVEPISSYNIGKSMGMLREGAKQFVISATWVDQQVRRMGGVVNNPTDEDLVFRGPQVVGLLYENSIFQIAKYQKKQLGSKTISWIIQANGAEVR